MHQDADRMPVIDVEGGATRKKKCNRALSKNAYFFPFTSKICAASAREFDSRAMQCLGYKPESMTDLWKLASNMDASVNIHDCTMGCPPSSSATTALAKSGDDAAMLKLQTGEISMSRYCSTRLFQIKI